MAGRTALGLGLPAALALLLGCPNDCYFHQRCEGNVLQECGYVDQVVNRKVRETPCAAPNEVCFAATEDRAACVHGPPTSCTEDTFAPRCEGEVLLTCRDGYVVGTACAEQSQRCVSAPASEGGSQADCRS